MNCQLKFNNDCLCGIVSKLFPLDPANDHAWKKRDDPYITLWTVPLATVHAIILA